MIKKIIHQIKSLWKKSTGIHAHDNMGKALENSIIAINNSVNWIDCTVTGMGRGPGNTKTEYLVLELNRKKQHLISLLNLIKNYFLVAFENSKELSIFNLSCPYIQRQ